MYTAKLLHLTNRSPCLVQVHVQMYMTHHFPSLLIHCLAAPPSPGIFSWNTHTPSTAHVIRQKTLHRLMPINISTFQDPFLAVQHTCTCTRTLPPKVPIPIPLTNHHQTTQLTHTPAKPKKKMSNKKKEQHTRIIQTNRLYHTSHFIPPLPSRRSRSPPSKSQNQFVMGSPPLLLFSLGISPWSKKKLHNVHVCRCPR